jgi:hypothetical protein
MNRGLSDLLKNAFPNVKAVKRPSVGIGKIKHAQWMAAFASGDGSFFIVIRKISTKKIKARVELIFSLTQHSRDESLLRRCKDFFQAGTVTKKRTCYEFRISKVADLVTKVLPIFKEAPIMGIKSQDFKD